MTEQTDHHRDDEQIEGPERPSWSTELKPAGLTETETEMLLRKIRAEGGIAPKHLGAVYRLGFEECIQRFGDLRINLNGFAFDQGLDRAAKLLEEKTGVGYDAAAITARVAVLAFLNVDEHEIDPFAEAVAHLPADAEPVDEDHAVPASAGSGDAVEIIQAPARPDQD